MQKILVPTDFTTVSENALKLAVDIARSAEASIFLVHFMDNNFGDSFSTTGEANTDKSEEDLFTIQLAKKNIKRLQSLASKFENSIKINYELYNNNFSDGVIDYIKEKNIDLVVLATTGERSKESFFARNHTEQLIMEATCPVILVRERYTFSTFNNIVVGIDLQQDSHDNFMQAATMLNSFVDNVGGELHLVHVYDMEDDLTQVEDKVRAFVKKHNFKNYTLSFTKNDDKSHGLVSYCVATGASILGVLTHTDRGVFSFFESEGTAQSLSKTSAIPLMIINLHNI